GDVGADEVALHAVLEPHAGKVDAAVLVAGDEVAGPGLRPAHEVVAGFQGTEEDLDADAVAQRPGAGHGGADVVALHDVVVAAVDRDADAAVARDQVAGAGGRPPDGAARAPARPADVDPGAVAERLRAGDVGADEVPLHAVPAPREGDAVAPVAGDEVA